MRGGGASRIKAVFSHAARWLAPASLVLMYHRVTLATRDPWQLAVTPVHFAEHLEVVRRLGRPLRVRDLTKALAAGRAPRGGIVLTLDDGYADNLLEARPLLEKHDVPATVFVPAGCVGRTQGFWWDQLENLLLASVELPPMLRLIIRGEAHDYDLGENWRYPIEAQTTHAGWHATMEPPTGRHRLFLELYRLLRPLSDREREVSLAELAAWSGSIEPASSARPLTAVELQRLSMDDLVEIGAHTLTHPQLSALGVDAQREEIHGSRVALQEAVGRSVVSFAYPYGASSDYTRETVALVAEAGFSGACATVPGVVRRKSARFELPRVHVGDCDGDGLARRLAEWT
jgi:peptidoglycan/xylan/chitin deacetylase (PgdA/CDA1 family)